MKYYNLTSEEQAVEDSFNKEEWKSVSNAKKAKEKYQQFAKNASQKTKTITIRISEADLFDLKSKALSNTYFFCSA